MTSERVHAQHRERDGAPRSHAELRAEGHGVSRKRVARLMRQHGIRARAPRRYRVCTTDSKHSLPVAVNLLDQNFVADRPDQNAPMESFFFGTLKTELVRQDEYPNRDAARRDLFAYIEGYYNRQRRHSAIGYITPEQAEAKSA